MGLHSQFMHGRPALGVGSEDVEVLLGLRTRGSFGFELSGKEASTLHAQGVASILLVYWRFQSSSWLRLSS